MMMMPLMLMMEQIWSHPISMEMRDYSQLPTLLKLLRELIEGLVGKQKSIHQLCGAVVLMEIATLEAIDAWSMIDRLDHHGIAST